MNRARLTVAALLSSGLFACTLEPGQGFASMEAGELILSAPEHVTTDLGYELELERAALALEELQLQRASDRVAAAADGRFDPANPPPGYSDCHGGHCHAEDGSLPSYAEIQQATAATAATAGGGNATMTTVLTMPVDAEVEAFANPEVPIATFEPSAELGEGSLDRLEVHVEGLSLAGRVDGAALDGPRQWTLELELHEVLAAGLSLQLGRDGPGHLSPRVELHLRATMLDGVDFAALADAGEDALVIDATHPATPSILEALLKSELHVEMEHSAEHMHEEDDNAHPGQQPDTAGAGAP
ncbi:MAG: hypothetical protein OEZ06_22985 [Myxococcales bacterium]|nr:hypothetical protein [Myxococcales bacterium]